MKTGETPKLPAKKSGAGRGEGKWTAWGGLNRANGMGAANRKCMQKPNHNRCSRASQTVSPFFVRKTDQRGRPASATRGNHFNQNAQVERRGEESTAKGKKARVLVAGGFGSRTKGKQKRRTWRKPTKVQKTVTGSLGTPRRMGPIRQYNKMGV